MLHLPLKCPIVKKIDVTFQIFIWKSCFSYGRFGFTNKMHVVSLTILLTHFCFLRLCGLDYLYHFKIYAHSLFYVLYGQTCYVLQNSAFCLLVWTEFGFAYTKQITLNKQMKEIVNSLSKYCLHFGSGVTTIAGGKWSRGGHIDGPSEDAKFSNDFDVVYIGSSCSLLVVDRGNQAIREIQLNFDDCAYQYESGFPLGTLFVNYFLNKILHNSTHFCEGISKIMKW